MSQASEGGKRPLKSLFVGWELKGELLDVFVKDCKSLWDRVSSFSSST